jgi:hypothetical protein
LSIGFDDKPNHLLIICLHSTDQNDPALRNAELEHTLLENERDAVMKTEKVERL